MEERRRQRAADKMAPDQTYRPMLLAQQQQPPRGGTPYTKALAFRNGTCARTREECAATSDKLCWTDFNWRYLYMLIIESFCCRPFARVCTGKAAASCFRCFDPVLPRYRSLSKQFCRSTPDSGESWQTKTEWKWDWEGQIVRKSSLSPTVSVWWLCVV